MIASPEVGFYPARTGSEQFLRIFPNSDIQVTFIEPFFEERNFLRRTIVELARSLASFEIGCFIPDLPGCGESIWEIDDIRLSDWRAAVSDAARWLVQSSGVKPHVASMRGGALLDDAVAATSWWRFAPASGAELLRPLRRASRLSGAEGDLAGYSLHPEMIAALERATPRKPDGPLQEYAGGSGGTPLWRRAEPSEDTELVRALAEDLAAWVRTCAAA